MVDGETSRLTKLFVDSHTQIIRGLSLLAPKSRRSRVRWILAAGLLVVVGVLATERSTREFATSKARDFYRAHNAPAAAPPVPAPAPVVVEPAPAATDTSVAWPAVQIPASVVVVQTTDPASPKGEGAPAAVPQTGNRSTRAPKTRGTNRPRVPASTGGT
jgi:hypothetical protein